MPGVLAGSMLVFIPSVGDFINADYLGSTQTTMIGNVIQKQFLVVKDYPAAAALSLVLMLIILGYAGVLALAFDLLITWVIGADYASVLTMSMWWALYFCINATRKIGNACLVGDGRFRELFHYSWITFVIGLPATIALTLQFGSVGAIIGLMVAEVLEIALTWLHGWKKVRAASS